MKHNKASKLQDQALAQTPRIFGSKGFRITDLRVIAEAGSLTLYGKGGLNSRLTELAISQLCTGLVIPFSYIGGLPATLAAQNINHALKGVEMQDVWVTLLMGAGENSILEVRL